jgi:pyrroline-5-carboxylate reductase
MKLAFIGLGNMATALMSGILEVQPAGLDGVPLTAKCLVGSAPSPSARNEAAVTFGITALGSNVEAVREADAVVLAVKPQVLPEVAAEIAPYCAGKLVISIAAGITLARLEALFGVSTSEPYAAARAEEGAPASGETPSIHFIRCMPNTPASIGCGCTSVCAASYTTQEEVAFCRRLFDSCGTTALIPESLFDAATAVAGSSPAFTYLYIESLADGAVAAGMPRAQAYEFAAQAVAGAAQLFLAKGCHASDLKDAVCSPAGTTIYGVKALEDRGFRGVVMSAVEASVKRAQEL